MSTFRSWKFFLVSCLLASSWIIPFADATNSDPKALNPTRILEDENAETDEASGGGKEADKDENIGGGNDEDPCTEATSCKECEDASSQLSNDTEVCQWALGTLDTLECMKKPKSEVEDMLGDMCSVSTADGSDSDGSKSPADSAGEPATSPTSKAPTSDGGLSYPEEEEGNGTFLAIVLLLVFVGIAYSNRDKVFKVLNAAEGFDGTGGRGEGSGSPPKPIKYHDV